MKQALNPSKEPGPRAPDSLAHRQPFSEGEAHLQAGTRVLRGANGKGFRKRGPQPSRICGLKAAQKQACKRGSCLLRQQAPRSPYLHSTTAEHRAAPCVRRATRSHPVCTVRGTRYTSLGSRRGPESICTGQHLGGKELRNKASLQTYKEPREDGIKIV